MAIPSFYDETYTTVGVQAPLLLHRWAGSNTAFVVDVSTTATYTLEGTLSRMDSDGVAIPVWFELSGLVNLTTDITDVIRNTPLSAIRISISAVDTEVRLQIRQSGEG